MRRADHRMYTPSEWRKRQHDLREMRCNVIGWVILLVGLWAGWAWVYGPWSKMP
jgi:hypothetical protein